MTDLLFNLNSTSVIRIMLSVLGNTAVQQIIQRQMMHQQVCLDLFLLHPYTKGYQSKILIGAVIVVQLKV